jgi:hypothetical protein
VQFAQHSDGHRLRLGHADINKSFGRSGCLLAAEPLFVKYLSENIMPAQDYERGRFAICDLFASSTGVVYGVVDSGVTSLPHITIAVFLFAAVLPLSVV